MPIETTGFPIHLCTKVLLLSCSSCTHEKYVRKKIRSCKTEKYCENIIPHFVVGAMSDNFYPPELTSSDGGEGGGGEGGGEGGGGEGGGKGGGEGGEYNL